MADEAADTAGLNVQQEDVAVIQPPQRSVPGGGSQSLEGPIRSVPGGGTTDLGRDARSVAKPQEKTDASTRNDNASGGDGAAVDGLADQAGDAATGAQEGAAGAEQQEGDAGGEGRAAALEAALAALPEETRTAFAPFQEAYSANGTLTPEEVTGAATALGVPESLVNFHLAAIQAATPTTAAAADPIEGELISAAYEAAGSKAAYAPFRDWLKTEGREDDIKVLSDAVDAKSPAMLKRLMAPLVAEFRASGQAPNTRRDITAEAAQGESQDGAVEGFATHAEMIEAQRVPSPKNPRRARYQSDPEYRAQVNRRIVASKFNGG